ncbi:hypothetical protein RUM44_006883 [Polyplax serrata]|uniref:Uncharacterized protein n=1 Tax=Polyplax serrata TaxID=468196 RepID=A0ABR1AJK4_POLSC
MEETEAFDDFLFDSITRYNTLQIFNLENIPRNIVQLDEFSICVSTQRSKGNNSELLRLQLPKKLFLTAEEEGRCKENDFKILSGAYTENSICSLGQLKGQKVVTSELGIKGLKIYNLTDKLGSNCREERLDVIPWLTPNFVVLNQKDCLVCTKSTQDPILLIDFETKKIIKDAKLQIASNVKVGDRADVNGNLLCEPLSTNVIALLNTFTGDLFLHDLRTTDVFNKMPSTDIDSDEKWTISRHESSKEPNFLGLLSNRQSVCIYDITSNSRLARSVGNNLAKLENNGFKLKFCGNQDLFSISGFDGNVEIYKIDNNNLNHIFTHNGHCPGNSKSYFVTDHIWLPINNKELVVSICNNKTLNCWEFINKSCTT